jgi:hypothetical protein
VTLPRLCRFLWVRLKAASTPQSSGLANRGGTCKSRIVNTQAQGLRLLGQNITGKCPSLFYAAFATLRKLYFGEPTTAKFFCGGRLALCYATSQRYANSPSRSIQSPATYPQLQFRQGMGKCQDNRKCQDERK